MHDKLQAGNSFDTKKEANKIVFFPPPSDFWKLARNGPVWPKFTLLKKLGVYVKLKSNVLWLSTSQIRTRLSINTGILKELLDVCTWRTLGFWGTAEEGFGWFGRNWTSRLFGLSSSHLWTCWSKYFMLLPLSLSYSWDVFWEFRRTKVYAMFDEASDLNI